MSLLNVFIVSNSKTRMKDFDILWYAMRVPYSREILFKKHLDSMKVENFIPMCYQLVEKNGVKSKQLVPVIHNLIFVRSSKIILDSIKSDIEYKIPSRYIMDKSIRKPLTVPDNQMENFISIAKTYDEGLIYLPASETKLKKGDKVRIIEGALAGIEGEFLRIKGDRRVIVSIDGLMSIATAFISPHMIERIE